MNRERRTHSQELAGVALKWLFALGLSALVIFAIIFGNGCSKSPATFTPAIAAPGGLTDEQVFRAADAWKAQSPAFYYATTADTHSMEPYYTAKSVPLLVRYIGQPIQNGAVAVFNRGPDAPRAMHVVSDQTDTHVYMSGVNNHRSDGWFPKSTIEGIVVGQLFRP